MQLIDKGETPDEEQESERDLPQRIFGSSPAIPVRDAVGRIRGHRHVSMPGMLDMAAGHELPISETIGVFLGVTGVDWLADGYAEPLKAVAFSLVAGTAIFLAREWMKKRRSKD
ncbi:MAG: hypothetical protein ACM31P_02855, partial [Actinomycetota bacterium]